MSQTRKNVFEVRMTYLHRYMQGGKPAAHRQRLNKLVWTGDAQRAITLAMDGVEAPIVDGVTLRSEVNELIYDASDESPRLKDLKFERGDGDGFVAVTALGNVILAPEDGVWALYVPDPSGTSCFSRSRSIHTNFDTAVSRAQKWLTEALAIHF